MNYADLFRVTLPETALEIAALLVLVVDLGFLRKATLKVRVTCQRCWAWLAAGLHRGVAVPGPWRLELRRFRRVYSAGNRRLCTGGAIRNPGADRAHIAITDRFRLHAPRGEYVSVVLMAAVGGLLIAGAQDLLVIFVGLELLSLGLYIMTAFAKSSAKSAEAAMKYYLFGGMSAAFCSLALVIFMD